MNRVSRFVLLVVGVFTAGAAYADLDCGNETTQQGMNICAANAARAADAALASEYQSDLKDIQADRRALLTAAQEAWSSYRDAQCSLEASQFDGGTMQPFALAACRERLATEHTRSLKEFWHEAIDK